jgi:hypothetical protein
MDRGTTTRGGGPYPAVRHKAIGMPYIWNPGRVLAAATRSVSSGSAQRPVAYTIPPMTPWMRMIPKAAQANAMASGAATPKRPRR